MPYPKTRKIKLNDGEIGGEHYKEIDETEAVVRNLIDEDNISYTFVCAEERSVDVCTDCTFSFRCDKSLDPTKSLER